MSIYSQYKTMLYNYDRRIWFKTCSDEFHLRDNGSTNPRGSDNNRQYHTDLFFSKHIRAFGQHSIILNEISREQSAN